MAPAWIRLAVEPVEPPPWKPLAPARARAEPPWILYVGLDEKMLDTAARASMAELATLDVIATPERPPLPVAVHRLPPPGLSGERLLYAPRLDAGFIEGPFCGGSQMYLLAALARIAAEGAPLRVVATALEGGAKDLVAQRGLASRFEIRRVSGPAPAASSMPATDMNTGGACEEALEGEPQSGLALLFEARRLSFADAVPLLKKAVAAEPDLAAAHYELGKALIRADDMEGALAAFRRTTELLPEYASAWGNLGAALGEVQELEQSADALTRAVALDPLNHALHSNLGVAYRDQGRLEEAETQFEKTLELAPEFVFGHYNRASVLFLTGRYGDAIASFEQARARDASGSPRQSLLLAVTRLAAGDREGAFRDYRDVFSRLDAPMKRNMRTIAEWDLKQLAQRLGASSSLREAAELLKSLA